MLQKRLPIIKIAGHPSIAHFRLITLLSILLVTLVRQNRFEYWQFFPLLFYSPLLTGLFFQGTREAMFWVLTLEDKELVIFGSKVCSQDPLLTARSQTGFCLKSTQKDQLATKNQFLSVWLSFKSWQRSCFNCASQSKGPGMHQILGNAKYREHRSEQKYYLEQWRHSRIHIGWQPEKLPGWDISLLGKEDKRCLLFPSKTIPY